MNKFIYLMLLPVVLGANILVGANNRLLIGHDKSYTFHSTPATFNEARNICEKEGGSLAVYKFKAAEIDMLEYQIRTRFNLNPSDQRTAQRIIAYRKNEEGYMEEMNCSSSKYVPWRQWAERQQPDSHSDLKYGSLLKQGQMEDVKCHFKVTFFCEKL